MRIRMKARAYAILLTLPVGTAHAQIDMGKADSLMRQCDVSARIERESQRVQDEILEWWGIKSSSLTPAQSRRMKEAFGNGVTVERRKQIHREVIATLGERDASAINQWCAGPIAKKLLKSWEALRADKQATEQQVNKGNELLRTMPESRKAVLRDLFESSRVLETFQGWFTMMLVSKEQVLKAAQSGRIEAATNEAVKAAGAQAWKLLEPRADNMFAVLAFGLAELSTDELVAYYRFEISDAGKRDTAALQRARMLSLRDSVELMEGVLYPPKD